MQAETETAPTLAPVVGVPVTLAPITVAQVHAILGAMASSGSRVPAQVAQWDILLRFLPWFALASGRTIEQVWAMSVDQYIVGVQSHLPEIATDERFAAAIDALDRAGSLLGAG